MDRRKRVINAFETWSRRRKLKIKWTYRITNEEVFQKGERRKATFRNFKQYTIQQ
jgi:hypothetical protein